MIPLSFTFPSFLSSLLSSSFSLPSLLTLLPPSSPLQSAGSVSSHTGLSSQMPDICIAYHLHLECGHLINLFDWLCAFVAVVDPAAAEKLQGGERRGHKEEVNSDLQYPTMYTTELHHSLCTYNIWCN